MTTKTNAKAGPKTRTKAGPKATAKTNQSSTSLEGLSLDDLKQLVSDAEKEMQRKRKAEVRNVRQQIEKLASDIGMTPAEVLAFDKRKSSKTVGEPKYRNPDNAAQTWTGRGKRPQWFIDAENKGISREAMEIK